MKYILLVFVSSLVIFAVAEDAYIDENDMPGLNYMNISVDPCDDFYEYTCGNFKNVYSIPSNMLEVDHFTLLQENLTNLAHEILEAEDLDEDPVALKKARAAYKACMDINSEDLKYLSNPELELIEKQAGFPLVQIEEREEVKFGWNDIGDLVADYGVPLMFTIASYADTTNSTKMMVYISNDPMGIPQEYRKNDASYDEIIEKGLYDMAMRSEGTTTTVLPMDEFLRFVSVKAKKAIGSAVSDDIIYDKLANITNFMKGVYFGGVVDDDTEIDTLPSPSVTLKELNTWTKKYFGDTVQLDWIEYLRRVFKNAGSVDINEDTTVLSTVNFNKLLYGVINWVKMNDPAIVKSMAMLRIFLYMAPDSDEETRTKFDAYLTAINQTTYPRWEYCTRKITDATGSASISFALTYEYQLRYFNVNKLTQALQMVRDIQQSFKEVINETAWMDDSSKEAALQKVDNLVTLLGYPDFVTNKTALDEFYENVQICKWDNYGNSKRIRAFQQAYQLNQYRNRDRTAWEKSPFDANAYYNRPNNRIIFPVAMLNPIFFGTNVSLLDYGRMGSIIGHEITHGFDNTGRLYDQYGNMNSWWTGYTTRGFQNRTACFVEQYGSYYIPEIDTYINGTTTLNENLADNGGTRNSYRAMTKLVNRLVNTNSSVPRTKKFSADQLFFIGFGTMWCNNESEDYLRQWQSCTSNCHARSKWRVNGVLSNMEEFSEAFSCPSGSNMNPEKKCRLW